MTSPPSLHRASSRCILAWSLLSMGRRSSKIHHLYAKDEVLQLDLHFGGVVAGVVDGGPVVELEIADVAKDRLVACSHGPNQLM